MWRWRGRCWHQETHQQSQRSFLQTQTCLEINNIPQKNETEVISKLYPLYSSVWLRMLGPWLQTPLCLPLKRSSKHNEHILATDNFKQATIQKYRTRRYDQHTRHKKVEMDWPRLKKERWQRLQNSTQVDICRKQTWTTQKSWWRTVEKELKQSGVKQNRVQTGRSGGPLCLPYGRSSGHEGDNVSNCRLTWHTNEVHSCDVMY